MSPFGVIDWAENGHALGAAAAVPGQPGVVGGPPAYLDAHGIRYVPNSSIEPLECSDEPSDQLVPMARSAGSDPAPVSQRELNSRVDERIRRFMRGGGAMSSDYQPRSGKLQSRDVDYEPRSGKLLSRDLDYEPRSGKLQSRDMDFEERRERLGAIRDRIRSARRAMEPESYGDAEEHSRRREPRRYDDDLDDPSCMDQDAGAELRALRRQMEEDVAKARGGTGRSLASSAAGRRLSQPVASRVSKAREELRKGQVIDF